MKRVWSKCSLGIFLCGLFLAFFSLDHVIPKLQAQAGGDQDDYGSQAYEHLVYLSEAIGARIASEVTERQAGNYIQDQWEKMGFQVTKQTFEITDSQESANYFVTIEGKSDKKIIIGAHYDSVNEGGSKGADDNASGVGLLLELSQRLKDQKDLPYSLEFIAFGAEEIGLEGSNYYFQALTDRQQANILGMINMDSLIAGDYLYFNAGTNGPTWLRDAAIDMGKKLGIESIKTNPGLNPDYPQGRTGPFSDHASFDHGEIAILSIEATNWEIGDKDGYLQTEKYGMIMHSQYDNLDKIQSAFPNRPQTYLKQVSQILVSLVKTITE